MLIGIDSSLQESGPFLFHGGKGMSGELMEIGHTIGLPQESIGLGGPTARPEVPAEMGGSAIMPQDLRGASPSALEQGRA